MFLLSLRVLMENLNPAAPLLVSVKVHCGWREEVLALANDAIKARMIAVTAQEHVEEKAIVVGR